MKAVTILGVPLWMIGVAVAAYFIFRKRGPKGLTYVPPSTMGPLPPGTEWTTYVPASTMGPLPPGTEWTPQPISTVPPVGQVGPLPYEEWNI